MIYQGQEAGLKGAGVPANREAIWLTGFDTNSDLYQWIKLMNQIRRQAINTNSDYLGYQSHVIYSDDSTIVFRKGVEGRQIVTVLGSGGEKTGPYELSLSTAFTTGTDVTDVVSCNNYTVNAYGQLKLPMGGGMPFVLYPATKMNGSMLCGFGNVSTQELKATKGGAESSAKGAWIAVLGSVVAVGAVVAGLSI